MDYSALIPTIAADFANAFHLPDHPTWDAYVADTERLFTYLLNRGMRFTLTGVGSPYATTADLQHDVATGHLYVYRDCNLMSDSPLARPSAVMDGWNVNLVARAVHDANGHGHGFPFETFQGEIDAYLSERSSYSDASQPAVYSEAVGNLCWYYAGNGFWNGPQESKVLPVRF